VNVPDELVIPQSLLIAVVEVARVIAPVTLVPAECWRERRPAFVRAPDEMERPVPVRSEKFSPLTMRLVVEAVTYDEYMVEEEYGKVILLAKVFVPDQKLVSASNVEEAVESERQVVPIA
jgi:hypothetical protein